MNVSLSLVDYGILLLYAGGLFYFGFRRGHGVKKGTDLFLGGRSLRWWQIGFSMFSANAGPIMLIGFAGIGFSQGMVGANFEWLAWIFILLLAMVFIPHYRRTKISTMPQFLLVRYGKGAYDFLTFYSLISILVVWLASALYAGGLLISQVFNLPLFPSMTGVAVIAASFTTLGGLPAVTRTGVFQSVIIIVSSVILTVLSLHRIGGVAAFIHRVPPSYLKLFRSAGDRDYSWVAVITGYPVVAIYYWCAEQTIVQKVLAAKSLEDGQYGAVFLCCLKILMPLIFIVPGIMCFILFKDIAGPDNAYITLVRHIMPRGLLGLSVSALVAALIDTLSSGLNSFSTIFTQDVVGRFRQMDDRQSRFTGRITTVTAAGVVLLLAMLFSLSGKGFFELTQGLISILAPPLSVVFLAGAIWKRANNIAAGWVLYGGGSLCLIVGACQAGNLPYKGYWPNFLLLSFYIFALLAVVMVAVSMCTKPSAGTALPSLAQTFMGSRPITGKMWWWWLGVAIVMGCIYFLFR